VVVEDEKYTRATTKPTHSIRFRTFFARRSVYDNIRRFLQFQLTVNVVALTITFLSAVFGYKPPLNAVMMLWVNLIMDTMGALALGTEPPTADLLDRRPYKRDSGLISRPMWRNILVQSLYQLVLLCFLLR